MIFVFCTRNFNFFIFFFLVFFFFIHQLLPQGRSVPLGNKLVTRSDTSDCLALIHNNKLIRTLEEKEMYVSNVSHLFLSLSLR